MMFQKRVLTAIFAIAALGLVSCGADEEWEAGAEKVSSVQVAATPTETDGHYPVVIGSCGRELVIKQSPQRVVSLNQSMTEILLSMGLEDRVVGTATWMDPVLPALAEANEGIPRLSDNNPSFQTVMAADPDFIVASFNSVLADTSSGSFERYAEEGIPAYVSYSECIKSRPSGVDDGERTTKMMMDDIYQDIRDLGNIFDEMEAADALIQELDIRLTEVGSANGASLFTRGEGASVAFWFSADTAPYIAGGYGAPQIISDMLGLENVYADSSMEWPQVDWQELAARSPDVLILGDLSRRWEQVETAEEKIEFLKSHPVTREMDAVKDERFIVLSGGEMDPSIRLIDGVEKVSEGLEELGLR